MIIVSAFSFNMIDTFPVSVVAKEISVGEARQLVQDEEFTSAVGHTDTAPVFSSVLGVHVPYNRATVQLTQGATALLGQLRGPRLPAGATSLPEGATIQWLLLTIG